MSIRTVQVGWGPIGAATARQLASRPGFELVGGVDLDPAKVGRDLGELAGLERSLGIPVSGDLESTLAELEPQAALVCTGSSLESVALTLEVCLRGGAAVVSSNEELAYPWRRQSALAGRLDRAARRAGRALLGTGVNPGFAMDALPITLTGVCSQVDSIRVRRVQDAARRRLPFQRKVGAGLSREEFDSRVAAGRLGHVGLTESIQMIADALGWELTETSDTIEPIVAEAPTGSDRLPVEPGQVCGLRQLGIGEVEEGMRIRLEFEAWVGAPESYDEVTIEGEPSLTSRIEGGVPGDLATASVLVNALPRVVAAPPGLQTMKDLPTLHCWQP